MPSFNPTKDIPSLDGRVILITGGTAGLGSNSVAELAKHNPAQIIFTGRNESKARELIAKVQPTCPKTTLQFQKCDISSFASIRSLASTLISDLPRLDIIMLNAGIMATPASVSTDGYQNEFATNHLGHALLVHLLLPLLQSTAAQPEADVRIINMTSIAYKQAPPNGIDFATLKSPQQSLGGALIPGHRWARYGQSKLAQMLYSRELAKHYPEITSVSVHPGVIMTGLFDDLPFLTTLPVMLMSLGKKTKVEEGHWNQCWAATAEKGKLRNGGYYEPWGVLTRPGTKMGNDEKLGSELWEWTQRQFEA